MSSPDARSGEATAPTNPNVKRLALVIHALHGGGAERLMSELANRWSAAGHDVHLITLADVSTDHYTVSPHVQRRGLNLMGNSRGPWAAVQANWQRVRALRAVLSELAPDCILSFCDRMNITTVTAALPLNKPLWIAEHSDPSRQHLGFLWETWRQWAYRRLARRPNTGCVVLTEAIAATMRSRFHGLDIQVIPPAIQLHHCNNTIIQENLPAHSGSGFDFQVLSMGRHSPEKNLVGLLKAWSQVASQFPRWRLVLAGDGPQHADLVDLVQRLQIDTSVHFTGWVNDPWTLYRQSSLLAMTSHYEGVPVAMLEAMGSGLACVSTPCSSSVEEFSKWGAIELARSTDPADIAQALSVVMADASRRTSLAQRGREVAQRFAWETLGPRWDEILAKLA